MKYCKNCGAATEDKANFCSSCGVALHNKPPVNEYRPPVHEYHSPMPSDYSEPMSTGLKVLFYLLTIAMPLVGIIIGLIYLNDPMEEKKRFGKGLLIFTVVWGIIWLIVLPIIGFSVFSMFMSDGYYYY
ncbi:zinc ribbon domain-containing protein [Irregularibacter muris]|uniref:Zinc ribbon domain-containing protein n=1 Tax=Irregularibacter muris TaxID=1796619 RepID=A0AAE3HFD4_9FIRM|nr:zinc ribbon domain-containing protein [Irregularibacter muris]MCR1899547.1 zinc ribbon domain-containing protein [Irregularibacter muris]